MNPDSKLIFKQVCETLNVPETDVLSKSRKVAVCDARYLCLYFIRTKNKSISLNTIGQWFGRSNNSSAHAFVIYGMNRVRTLREIDLEFKQKFTQCLNDLKYFDSNINYNNISQF